MRSTHRPFNIAIVIIALLASLLVSGQTAHAQDDKSRANNQIEVKQRPMRGERQTAIQKPAKPAPIKQPAPAQPAPGQPIQTPQPATGSADAPKCGAMYVNVSEYNLGPAVYELDDDAELAQDLGSFGLDDIVEIAWRGQRLFAIGERGSNFGLFHLNISSGTSSFEMALDPSQPEGGLGGTGDADPLVISTSPIKAVDLDPNAMTMSNPTFLPASTKAVMDIAVSDDLRNILVKGSTSYGIEQAGPSGNLVGFVPLPNEFTGLADRGGALFAINPHGSVYDVANNVFVGANPAYASAAYVRGAAAYFDAAVCDPYQAPAQPVQLNFPHTPVCGTNYVNVVHNDGTHLVFELDASGDLAVVLGTFGLEEIREIAWVGPQLYAVGSDGLNFGLYELDLDTGWSTFIPTDDTLDPAHNPMLGGGDLGDGLEISLSLAENGELDPASGSFTPWPLNSGFNATQLGDAAFNSVNPERIYSYIGASGPMVEIRGNNGDFEGSNPAPAFFVGLVDRGEVPFGITVDGDIYRLDYDDAAFSLLVTSNVNYANMATVHGAAAFSDSATCNIDPVSLNFPYTPACGSRYVNVTTNWGQDSIYLLDADGELALDLGSFGLSDIIEIAWYGDQLFAVASDSGSTLNLHELDLTTGTSSAPQPVTGIPSNSAPGLAGGIDPSESLIISYVSPDPANSPQMLTLASNGLIGSFAFLQAGTTLVGDLAYNGLTGEIFVASTANDSDTVTRYSPSGYFESQSSTLLDPLVGLAYSYSEDLVTGVTSAGEWWRFDNYLVDAPLSNAPAYSSYATVEGAASYYNFSC